MADRNEHVEDLAALRLFLVQLRRKEVANGLDLHRHNSEMEPYSGASSGKSVMDLQVQIEAIDRAIADERALVPPLNREIAIAGTW